jgi:hypothetical protein
MRCWSTEEIGIFLQKLEQDHFWEKLTCRNVNEYNILVGWTDTDILVGWTDTDI